MKTALTQLIGTLAEDKNAIITKADGSLPNTWNVIVRDNTAIIPVHGPIFRYGDFYSLLFGGSSIQKLSEDLDEAVNNPEISSIILDIDSPGGQVNGINEFSDMVRAANDKKPVYAYVGGTAASAAYWIASSCARIVVDKTAQLGSIGVVIGFYKDDDDDYVEIVSTASPKKRMDLDDEKAELQQKANELADIFIGAVAKNRKVKPETVIKDFGQGGVLIGDKAVNAGMADEIGSMESLIKSLSTKQNGGYYMATLKEQFAGLIAQGSEAIGALNDLGFVAKKSDGDFAQVKVLAKEEGLNEGIEQGKTQAMDTVASIINLCAVAGLNDVKAIREHVLSGSVDQVSQALIDGKAQDTENNNIQPQIQSENVTNLLIEDAKRRRTEFEGRFK